MTTFFRLVRTAHTCLLSRLPATCLLLFCFSLPASAQANCTDDSVACLPGSVSDDGVKVSQSFDLDFFTIDQDMWAPGGERTTTISSTVVSPQDAKFRAELRGGDFKQFCLYDELDDLLSDVSIFTYSLSDVIKWFKDEFSNPCYWYGAGFHDGSWFSGKGAYVSGDFGLDVDVEITGGTVSAELPVNVTIEYPSDFTYRPGQTITLGTRVSDKGAGSLSTSTPSLITTPTFKGSVKGKGVAEGCVDDCSFKTLWNFNEAVEASLDLRTPRLVLNSNNPTPTHLVEYALGIDGIIGIPDIVMEKAGQSGFNLTASDSDTYVDITIDLDEWISRLAKRPNLLAGGSVELTPVGDATTKIGYSLVNFSANVDASMTQEAEFSASVYVEFHLSSTLPYSVLAGSSVVASGTSSLITVEAGQDVQLHLPTDLREEIQVSSRVFLDNEFSTRFKQRNISSMDVKGLKGTFSTPSWTIFNSRCINLFLGEICTPKLTWDAFSASAGPAIDKKDVGKVDYSYTAYESGSWELQGFQKFPLAPFTLIANTPPEVQPPQDIILEAEVTGGVDGNSDSVIAWLNQATATDNEDGELPVTHSALPALLTVGSSTVVTFSTVDSFGQGADATATLSVVDTTAPILQIEELTLVAEGPTGTPVPDTLGEVEAWLDSLVVDDIADPSPAIAESVPTFLDLGANTVSFIATDASGNQGALDSTVYVRSPFVLFADNSIRIDRNVLVESGFVAVPAATPGPWLSNQAQVDIDRQSSLVAGTQLFSDSIHLDSGALANEAYYNFLTGKGTVVNSGAFVSGIYYPADSLPTFITGTEHLRVGCKQSGCLGSGTVLPEGAYNTLVIEGGKKSGKGGGAVLYLAGGTYTFSSVTLQKYAELRALAPSVILVSGNLDTDQRSYIGPDDLAENDAGDLTIMVNGVDELHKKSDKSAKSGKSEKSGKSAKASAAELKIKVPAIAIGESSEIQATVFAPHGSIEVDKGTLISGSLSAENIDLDKDVTVRFVSGF